MKIFSSKTVGLTVAVGLAIAASSVAVSAATVDLYDGTFGNLTVVVSRPCSTPCTPPVGYAPPQATITTGVTTPNADSIKADNSAITANFNWTASSPNGAGVGILDNALIYNPSVQGAIISLDVSLDKMLTASTAANPARVLLEQDGNYYLYTTANSPLGTTAGQYTKYTGTSLTALDFTQICIVACGTGNFGNSNNVGNGVGQTHIAALNLTSGDSVVFGVLFSSNSTVGTASVFYDNLEVDITHASATPLPSTWLMMLSGFFGLGFFAYRGTTKRASAIAAI